MKLIKISEKYYFREARLAQVVGEGKPLAEAYPNLPSDILAKLQEEVTARFGTKTKRKKTKKTGILTACMKLYETIKKKLNHD